MVSRRSWAQRWTYSISRVIVRFVLVFLCRARIEGAENFPSAGGGLVCANHQSFLDPLLVGMTCPREMCYVARETLFDSSVLRWLMRWYNTIPIRRDGLGLSAIKEIVRRLKSDELVLIFPEGTRTHDGEVGELRSGFCAIARRTTTPLVPVAIAGAYQIWPRDQKWPRRGKVAICIGEAIPPQRLSTLADEELVAELTQRILKCHASARRLLK